MPGIIVGIDGSGHSRKALEWAIKEAAAHHSALTVLTVHQAAAGYFGNPASYPDDVALTEKASEAARAETEQVLAGLGGARPASITIKAVNGFPVEVLIDAGKDADMIVLGSRGTGGFSRLMLGSTASQVAHYAQCPVLIVPAEERA